MRRPPGDYEECSQIPYGSFWGGAFFGAPLSLRVCRQTFRSLSQHENQKPPQDTSPWQIPRRGSMWHVKNISVHIMILLRWGEWVKGNFKKTVKNWRSHWVLSTSSEWWQTEVLSLFLQLKEKKNKASCPRHASLSHFTDDLSAERAHKSSQTMCAEYLQFHTFWWNFARRLPQTQLGWFQETLGHRNPPKNWNTRFFGAQNLYRSDCLSV